MIKLNKKGGSKAHHRSNAKKIRDRLVVFNSKDKNKDKGAVAHHHHSKHTIDESVRRELLQGVVDDNV